MAATKPYANYTWYKDEFGGTVLSEEDFPKHARWASYLIDEITFGNIKDDSQVLDCVKDATCAAAELEYNYYLSTIAVEGGRGKKSETNDGYSVSYDDSTLTAAELKANARDAIMVYLKNSGLLFRGVRCRGWPYW